MKVKKLIEKLNRDDWEETGIDWQVMEARYNAAYGNRTPSEKVILEQMTAAWSRTLHIMNLRKELLRTCDMTDPKAVRSVDLELASYADGALANWHNLEEILCTSPEGVAAAMDAEGEKMRRIPWIAPSRACILDYRALVALQAKRYAQSKS